MYILFLASIRVT